MSIPEMWLPIMNEIETDSELRGKFQFWAFGYPTGDPEALLAEEKPEMLFGRKAPSLRSFSQATSRRGELGLAK